MFSKLKEVIKKVWSKLFKKEPDEYSWDNIKDIPYTPLMTVTVDTDNSNTILRKMVEKEYGVILDKSKTATDISYDNAEKQLSKSTKTTSGIILEIIPAPNEDLKKYIRDVKDTLRLMGVQNIDDIEIKIIDTPEEKIENSSKENDKQETLRDCPTCQLNTNPMDTSYECYLCCKGLEYHYTPINNK